MADLDLLVDYVSQLKVGLEQADQFTRAGELGKAVWAYLAVLEVDPDNPTARRQVSQVATAVRQFDRTAPGRRWLFQLRGEKPPGEPTHSRWRWAWLGVAVLVLVSVFILGHIVGEYCPLQWEWPSWEFLIPAESSDKAGG
jgi:hypothetical protein